MAPSCANPDIILIGGGVMSANLGALIKRLDPRLRIQVFERGEAMAMESSNGWSNAGTGHAGLCELSYTPSRGADGTVNVDKALEIFGQFEETLQFWSYAAASGMAEQPADFIRPVPHLSFVHGREQVEFLRSRFAGLSRHPFFETMEFTTDPDVIAGWAPLLMEGQEKMPVAATKVDTGTDVDFGVLARRLLAWLGAQEGCAVASRHRVDGLRRCHGGWEVEVTDLAAGTSRTCRAKFVFVGAGGGSLPLLQKAGIPEARGLGGFPIGGQWLVCRKPEIVRRHQAKVYGQALDAAPTMAVPHLDTRVLNGQKALLFGPFAAWTGKFLQQQGSWLDLPLSVRPDNLLTLLRIGWSNLPLIHYLMKEGAQSMDSRLAMLRQFYPEAHEEDWTLERAGIRVQAIKKTDGEAGIVHYGTELIKSADHSIAALLGASPGASVCVHIAVGVIRACLPHLLDSDEGRERMREMIPARGEELRQPENAGKFRELHRHCLKTLGLI
ncbi:MAG: mqo [Verrucomicrobiales bacterium]|nr:mqo [Verrucomicrobiales bacterium]